MEIHKVSSHAITRFKEKTGCKKTVEQIKNKVLKLAQQGAPIQPKGKSAALMVMNNNYRDYEYRFNGGWVFVVREGIVITILQGGRQWQL